MRKDILTKVTFVVLIVIIIFFVMFGKEIMAAINGLIETGSATQIGGNYGKDLYDGLHERWLCKNGHNL